MPEGTPMEFVRALGSRIKWECPACGHSTMTAKNVLERITDHVTRERRRVGLLSVCEIAGIYDVWWYSDVGRAFDHEGRHATELQNEHPEWFVHSR